MPAQKSVSTPFLPTRDGAASCLSARCTANKWSIVLAILVASALPTEAYRTGCAAPIHAIGNASTSSFSQGSSAAIGATARGWEFQVNAANVQVTQLGVNAWTDSTPITLSLWDDNTQVLLAQTVATASAHQWVFSDLGSPVVLTAGGKYSVIGWANVTTTWYQYSFAPPPAFEPTGTIQYIMARVDNGRDPNNYPAGPFAGQFGVTDIGYQFVPEPSALMLSAFAAGLSAGGWRRKRTL
jgi:hypothetical protein